MNENRFKLHYSGSIGWLIFWFIVFFPIAFILLLTACSFETNQRTYSLHYDGSRPWLCFWFVVFFPVAILLLFINGFAITVDRTDDVIEATGIRMPDDSRNDPKT